MQTSRNIQDILMERRTNKSVLVIFALLNMSFGAEKDEITRECNNTNKNLMYFVPLHRFSSFILSCTSQMVLMESAAVLVSL